MAQFLPMTPQEMQALHWDQPDFIVVTGDAYIDHPSFGPAIIARVLEDAGFRVAVIAQPDWHGVQDFQRFGRPRLAFLVSAGNIDSMVCHYTASKKARSDDAYTPGGKAGKRPDRACIVYTNQIRKAFRKVPVILGGIEASLRRFAHYDYWDDAVRRSILVDAGADLLIYGMGEKPVVEVARAMDAGVPLSEIRHVRGTCYHAHTLEGIEAVQMPSFMQVREDKHAYGQAFLTQQQETDGIRGVAIAQAHEKGYVVANPPPRPLTVQEMDAVYALPYTRQPHPSYTEPIPALSEVEFSITSCRGCFGACSFCALTYHQGRTIQVRSHASILREARQMVQNPRFKGYIHDVGGPTANFRQPSCKGQMQRGVCKERQCLHPRCKQLVVSHDDYRALLQKLRRVPGVKKVFVRSGLRYDYMMYDKDERFFDDLVRYHLSGQLKVAPEHVSARVLKLMGKPEHELYDAFVHKYRRINEKFGMNQFMVPYFMSSHPGSDLHAAIELACYLKRTGQRPEQVQDFYPTPGTLSTTMFYTGMDPRTGQKVYIPRSPQEKRLQRALLQFYRKENAPLVREALQRAGRTDLIGYGKECLVWPERDRQADVPKAAPMRKEHAQAKKPPRTKVQKRPVSEKARMRNEQQTGKKKKRR